MSYTYNASDVSNGLMKEGDYEVTLERMERKVTPNGKEKLSVMYRVRSDVEQAYKNKCVFEDIWEEKENPGIFNRKRLNQLLGTQEIEDGREFEDINGIINFLVGSNLIVHVSVELDTYREEDVNAVSYYKSTKNKPQSLGDAQPAKPTENKPDGIVQDDLPF